MNLEGQAETRPGLSWKTLLAIFFAVFVIQPIIIYYSLITNIALPMQAWIVILLWTELARALGAPLSRQEVFILISFQTMATAYALAFVTPIKNMYYSTSPESQAFGIIRYVPSWWAPPASEAVQILSRKWIFLQPSISVPISIMLVSIAFSVAMDIALGYFSYNVYARVQKLEFPMAKAVVQTIITLAEREKRSFRVLMLSFLLGAFYNSFTTFFPFLLGPYLSTGGAADPSMYFVTSPIASSFDLTTFLANFIPGAGLAFTMNMVPYIMGFILPLWVGIAQFIGAFAFYFIGTHMITRMNLWPVESAYSSSWPIFTLVQRSQLYFYISVTIGLTLAATFIPLALRPRVLTQAFKGFLSKGTSNTNVDRSPLRLSMLLFFLASAGLTATVHFLAPAFPIYILILFIMGGSFFTSLLSVGVAGISFSGFNIPYQRELIIYTSGYQGRDVWFAGGPYAPMAMSTNSASIAQNLMQADICRVSHNEYFKAYIIVVALGMFSSFLFVSLFWNIAPIPSGAYPATISLWPIDAMDWARTQQWVWTGYLFRFDLIMWSFIIGSIITFAANFILKNPLVLLALVSSTNMYNLPWWGDPISVGMAMMIGSIVANKVLSPRFGKAFDALKGNFFMGVTLGWGFMEVLKSILILIGRSMWILPF